MCPCPAVSEGPVVDAAMPTARKKRDRSDSESDCSLEAWERWWTKGYHIFANISVRTVYYISNERPLHWLSGGVTNSF